MAADAWATPCRAVVAMAAAVHHNTIATDVVANVDQAAFFTLDEGGDAVAVFKSCTGGDIVAVVGVVSSAADTVWV